MSKVVVTKEKLTAIGDAIREKTETSEGLGLDTMPQAIRNIKGGADFTINDASYLFTNNARSEIKDELISLLKDVTDMNHMYCNSGITEIDLSSFDTSKVTDMSYMFSGCANLQTINMNGIDLSNTTNWHYLFHGTSNLQNLYWNDIDTSNITNMGYLFGSSGITNIDFSHIDTSKVTNMASIFSLCKQLESITGFSATNKSGISLTFPAGTSASSPVALRRLTFRTDLPEGTYSIRSAINIKYCSFDREGMVEMFNTLPDISSLNLGASYKKITITGNPCLTDGTLTDNDRAIATNKGWTLVE